MCWLLLPVNTFDLKFDGIEIMEFLINTEVKNAACQCSLAWWADIIILTATKIAEIFFLLFIFVSSNDKKPSKNEKGTQRQNWNGF